MSYDLTLYIDKNHNYSLDELRTYIQDHFSSEFHPDFTFDDSDDLVEWKISSKIMNDCTPETFYQSRFEIYPMTKDEYPELYENISIPSEHGFFLCCYETIDIVSALIFSSYFISHGGVLFSQDEDDFTHSINFIIKALLKEIESDLSTPDVFIDWE